MKAVSRRTIIALAALLPVVAALTLLCACRAGAQDSTPISKLVENMKEYDGKEVTIKGEAIGDLMARGTFAWITVDDDPYSLKSLEEDNKYEGMSNMGIGVWITTEDARKISVFGGYKNKGDKVVITGVFHRACHEHGGDTDIHADSMKIISPGHPFPHPFQYGKLIALLIFLGAIALLWRVRRKKLKKEAREE